MKRILISTSIGLFLCINLSFAQGETIKGIIKDAETKEPLPYTIITDENEFLYYGLSDTLGEFKLKKNKIADKIKFQLIAYKPVIYESNSIPDIVYLKKKPVEIPEVTVKGITIDKVIKNAGKVWKNKYRATPYLASGVYNKTTKCRNQYVEFIQGFGYFMGSGYKKHKKFDNFNNSYFDFVMTNARVSNNYAKAGKDILLNPKRASSRKISYDSGNREIFMAYRAIEAFGPLSSKMGWFFSKPMRKYYKFILDSICSGKNDIYIIKFQTKDQYVPSKLKLECQGKMWIDGSDFSIKKYSLDFINYLYIPFFNLKDMKLPYLAKLFVSFEQIDNQLFPKNIKLIKYWANNPGTKYTNYPPSRMRPAQINLVEKEKFEFIHYGTEEEYENITIKEVPLKRWLGLLESNPKIRYNKTFWENKNFKPDDWNKIQSDLSAFEPLSEQFKKHNNKYYYSFLSLPHINNNQKKAIKTLWGNTEWIETISKIIKEE